MDVGSVYRYTGETNKKYQWLEPHENNSGDYQTAYIIKKRSFNEI
jgi:hypothetical protein